MNGKKSLHTKVRLSEKLIEQIIEKIISETAVSRIVLFGSTVRDDCRATSDIDIALFGITAEKTYLLKDKLNEELDTLRDVDIVLFGRLKNERLKERILKEGVVIYERNTEG